MLGGFVWVLGDYSNSTPPSTSVSAEAFPFLTPINSGDCSGAFWFFMNCGVQAKRSTLK